MAKKEAPRKHFDCKTCNEKIDYLQEQFCSLRINWVDDLQVPNDSARCANIKICNWYSILKG